ncbi:phosphate acetyltransferase [Gardnerella sp. KA00255]|uniref:phosphate acetyltransferase n=1 Tax=Gardnerella sp. KA00255 TaxID=2749073 RepID=UPI003BA88DED
MSLLNVTIVSAENTEGRNAIALGITKVLSKNYSTTIFRPFAQKDDDFTTSLLNLANSNIPTNDVIGLQTCEIRNNKDIVRGDIVAAYHEVLKKTQAQACLIVASDFTPVYDPDIFAFDAQVAADLASPIFLVVSAKNRNSEQILETIDAENARITKESAQVLGIFVTDCSEEIGLQVIRDYTSQSYTKSDNISHIRNIPLWVLPELDSSDIDKTLESFNELVKEEDILNALRQPFNASVTPYAFQYSLLGKAQSNKKTIVLPEGQEDRILKAADYLLERDIVNLIIVGERESILERAEELNLHSVCKASFQSMHDEAMLSHMVTKLCELRSKKGMTEKQAREQLTDASYFGTMLVVLGQADGLVSGSVNSTANTVRPALQVIKTKPGSKLVSGAFIMCFKDHVAIFADCAINPNPTAEQLADIAIQSAATASAFGLEPKVGMLSYSTLGSGKGPDVDLVEEATRLVHEKAPDLQVVGSIQFDAAWSTTVAESKAKGNSVAGHVNVFVFPDLCAGNIAYKAVQRSSGALAVGPILQGLNKPVNDLSRGALVQDIINTVALTALEAQSE